jgi:hypothetical protein
VRGRFFLSIFPQSPISYAVILMECNFLSGRYMLKCIVGPRSYVPSSFELGEYCKTKQHRICPLYFARQCEQRKNTGIAPSFNTVYKDNRDSGGVI